MRKIVSRTANNEITLDNLKFIEGQFIVCRNTNNGNPYLLVKGYDDDRNIFYRWLDISSGVLSNGGEHNTIQEACEGSIDASDFYFYVLNNTEFIEFLVGKI